MRQDMAHIVAFDASILMVTIMSMWTVSRYEAGHGTHCGS